MSLLIYVGKKAREILNFKEVRFLISGLSANLIAFIFYLILVQLGLDPKYALTIMYWSVVLYLYVVNKLFVFNHRGSNFKSFLKFVTTYFVGYFISITLLTIALNYFLLNYIIAMVIASTVMPFYFYAAQKYVVFKTSG